MVCLSKKNTDSFLLDQDDDFEDDFEDDDYSDSFSFNQENESEQYNSKYVFETKVSCHNCGRSSKGIHLLSSVVSRQGSKAYVFCLDCGRPDDLTGFIRYNERCKQLSLF